MKDRNNSKERATPEKKSGGEVVISFDMNEDNNTRLRARKEYEIAKNFKLANLPLYKFYSANNISSRKQFNLSQTTDLTILEISLTGNKEKDFDKINQAKDFILTQENIELIDDKDYRYERSNLVHRFLINCK